MYKNFECQNNVEFAYILGTILNNIKEIDVKNNKIKFYVECKTNDYVVSLFHKIMDEKNEGNGTDFIFEINKKEKLIEIFKFFNVSSIEFLNMSRIDNITLSNLENDEALEFIKAYYEKYGNLYYDSDNKKYVCNLTSYSRKQLDDIAEYMKIPCKSTKMFNLESIVFQGSNILDFLGLIYKNKNLITNMKLFEKYNEMIGEQPVIKYIKIQENAVTPTKANFSDVGFDLTIINEHKRFNSKTKLYNTGIKLEIPIGYYVEIVPRSSISKSGYILANSIGIIDCSYKGELFVALTKIDEESPDITFPFKCCQLIVKKQIFPDFVETTDLTESRRADGGFGSSD